MASQDEINKAKLNIAAGTPTKRDLEVAQQTMQQAGKDNRDMQTAIAAGNKKNQQAKRPW